MWILIARITVGISAAKGGIRKPTEKVPVTSRESRLSSRASAKDAGSARPSVSTIATAEISSEFSSACPRSAVCQAVRKLCHSQCSGSAKGWLKISMLVLSALAAR